MISVPAISTHVPARPEAARRSSRPNANGGVSSVNGITHARAGHERRPARHRTTRRSSTCRRRRRHRRTRHALQNAIDAAAAGQPAGAVAGTYNENVARVEAAEDPGPRPRRHHRRARAPGPRPRGPAVQHQRARSSTAASSSRTRRPSTPRCAAHAPYAGRHDGDAAPGAARRRPDRRRARRRTAYDLATGDGRAVVRRRPASTASAS